MAEPKDAEFRGSVPRRFLELLDACALAEGMSRMDYAMSVLQPEIDRRLHSATVLCRVAGINPAAPDRGVDARIPTARGGA